MTRNRLKLTDFMIMVAGLVILTGAYCFALSNIDADRAACTTDWECSQTPDCLADPTCDGGPQ